MKTDNLEEIIIDLNTVVCEVKFYIYQTGRLGFYLIRNNEKFIQCTLDLLKCEVNENEVIIKDYNENKGLYQGLLNAKFIEPYNRRVSVGVNFGLVCKLNMNYKFKKG